MNIKAFKEGRGIQGGKGHSRRGKYARREEAFKKGNFWFGMKEVFEKGKSIQGGKRHSRREIY